MHINIDEDKREDEVMDSEDEIEGEAITIIVG
jgi:hypothetical protein